MAITLVFPTADARNRYASNLSKAGITSTPGMIGTQFSLSYTKPTTALAATTTPTPTRITTTPRTYTSPTTVKRVTQPPPSSILVSNSMKKTLTRAKTTAFPVGINYGMVQLGTSKAGRPVYANVTYFYHVRRGNEPFQKLDSLLKAGLIGKGKVLTPEELRELVDLPFNTSEGKRYAEKYL